MGPVGYGISNSGKNLLSTFFSVQLGDACVVAVPEMSERRLCIKEARLVPNKDIYEKNDNKTQNNLIAEASTLTLTGARLKKGPGRI